jgi:hypothetical protein
MKASGEVDSKPFRDGRTRGIKWFLIEEPI